MTEEILSSTAWDASFVQEIHGYIGQLQMVKDGPQWLLFNKSQERVGLIDKEHEIYRITDILIQPFGNIEQVIDPLLLLLFSD